MHWNHVIQDCYDFSVPLLVCVSAWMRARILLFIALYSLLHFYRFVESICKKYFDFVEWCVIFIYKEKIDEPTKPEQIGQDEDAKRKCRKRRTSERKAKHIHSGTGDGQSEDVVAITYKPNADTLSFPPFNIEKYFMDLYYRFESINQSKTHNQLTNSHTFTALNAFADDAIPSIEWLTSNCTALEWLFGINDAI